MKKLLSLFLAVSLALALSPCAIADVAEDYEITYQMVHVEKYDGSPHADVLVEITNTGDKTLVFSDSSYQLVDLDGNFIITDTDGFSWLMDTIAPGETILFSGRTFLDDYYGYLFGQSPIENYYGDGKLVVKPYFYFLESDDKPVRYDTTDVTVEDGPNGAEAQGQVFNNTANVCSDNIGVLIEFYDEDGVPIDYAFDLISTPLAPGESIGFDAFNRTVSADDVAEVRTYAYPMELPTEE